MKKCLMITLLSLLLTGRASSTKTAVEKLKEEVPVSSYKKVSEMKDIQLDEVITNDNVYAVTIDDTVCYFFGEDPGILIIPDENRDQILSYFASEDEIRKINTDFEEFVKDESVAFSAYVIGNHHVQFFKDANQKPYVQITFP